MTERSAIVDNGRAVIRVLGSEHTEELEQVRQFFRNYAAWLGVELEPRLEAWEFGAQK